MVYTEAKETLSYNKRRGIICMLHDQDWTSFQADM